MMRSGNDVLKVGRIETSIDSQLRRQHKIFPVLNVDRNSVSVSALHDTTGTDLLIETHATLGIGEHIEFHLPDASFSTAAVIWTNGLLAGCRFIEPTTSSTEDATLVEPSEYEVPLLDRRIMHDSGDGEWAGAASGTLPPSRKIWFIVGLALSLWILIGAATLLVWSKV